MNNPFPTPGLARVLSLKNHWFSSCFIGIHDCRVPILPYIVDPLNYDVLRTREIHTSAVNSRLYCGCTDLECTYFLDSEHIEIQRIDNIMHCYDAEIVNAYETN